jgi:hypothetical protein
MQKRSYMQEIAQPKQNSTEEELVFPTSNSAQDRVSQRNFEFAAHQRPDSSPLDTTSQVKGDSPSTIAGLACWAQHAAEIRAEKRIDPDQSTTPFFGKFGLDNSRLSLTAPIMEVPYIQQSAKVETTAGDNPLTERPDSSSDAEDEVQSCASVPKKEDSNVEIAWREVPQGPDYALQDLTFLFTGQLEYISREKVQALIKRHHGKVTLKPSRNTDYVVLGAEPGPEKLAIVKKLNLEIINERGLFDLILRRMKCIHTDSEQKKATEKRIKRFNKEVKTTWTAINTSYQYDWTSTSGYQPQERTLEQQQQREQQVASTRGPIFLDPQSKAFLIDFKVFPPSDIDLDTPEYESYESSIVSTLIKLIADYEHYVLRFRWYHGDSPPYHPDLEWERYRTLDDLGKSKSKIDEIRDENEKNRLAWIAKSAPPQLCKENVASATASPPESIIDKTAPLSDFIKADPRKSHFDLTPNRKTGEMTERKSHYSDRQKRMHWGI